ncbi:LysE family translocator [Methylobacterium sp. W2]|uniref:LysE family translocator n=1 Tax=Methylobacterium sp. W2 TaxID=2598107 RepID=UPI001D0CC189|nr:LysE family translocator [Methylobacterium sp. W2]
MQLSTGASVISLAHLVVFAAIYAAAVASPGPGIAALVARVLAVGTRGIGAFVAGFIVGDLVWFAMAAGGFSLIAQAFAPLLVALKYAGAIYLAVLAFKAWTSRVYAIDAAPLRDEGALRLFAGGLAVTLGNPKVILFFLALLPTVVDLDRVDALGLVELGATIVLVLGTVLSGYVLAAERARRVMTSVRARRLLNRGAGTVMAGAAVAIASR